MKILHINDHLASRGGVETYLLSLVPRLETHGHEVEVAFGDGDAALVRQATATPAVSTPGAAAEPEARRQIGRVLDRFQPDVVHLHSVYNVGAIASALERVPVVLHGHDYRYLCPNSSFFFRRTQTTCERTCGLGCFAQTAAKHCLTPRPGPALAYYRRVRWVAANAGRLARVIAPSRAAGERFTHAGFGKDQVVVLPYFCPIPPLSVPRPLPTKPTITYMGRLSANKGWRYFIGALGRLPAEVRGILVGNLDTAHRAEAQRVAASAGCADRLELRAWAGRDEIGAILRQTSVFVFPSIWPETLGIVGLEALASGVPVVASDIGGVREWLVPEKTGLLVPPKDSGAIADAVRTILRNEQGTEAMGRNGLALIRDRFLPEQHVSQMVEVYTAAAGVSASASTRLAPAAA